MKNSIEIWIKPNKTQFVIIEKDKNTIKVDPDGCIEIYLDDVAEDNISIEKLNIGEWNQIILINDFNSICVYINTKFSDIMFANEIISFNYFSNIENHNIKIGGAGVFGSFVIYPRIFTTDDIKSLYSTGLERYKPAPITIYSTKSSNDKCELDELNELEKLYIMYLHTYTAKRIADSDNRCTSIHIGLEETLSELEKCAKEDFEKVIGMSIFAVACNDEKILSFKSFCELVDEIKKEL